MLVWTGVAKAIGELPEPGHGRLIYDIPATRSVNHWSAVARKLTPATMSGAKEPLYSVSLR